MTNIEQLKKETNEITDSLKKLKENVSLSETDKKTQAEALKTKAEQAKQKIQSEIDALKDKTDDESKKKKEEAETLLNSFNETMSLYNSVLNNGNTGAESATETTAATPVATTETKPEEKEDDKKGIFTKSKEWVGEQWNKAKANPGKYLLGATGILAAGVAIKKAWDWAFGNDEEEEDEETDTETKSNKKKKKSFWKTGWGNFVKWASIGTVSGTAIYGLGKWLGRWGHEGATGRDSDKEKFESYEEFANKTENKEKFENYEGLGDKVDNVYQEIYSREIKSGLEDELAMKTVAENQSKLTKHYKGIVPYCLDNQYRSVEGILGQNSSFLTALSNGLLGMVDFVKNAGTGFLELFVNNYMRFLPSWTLFDKAAGSLSDKLEKWKIENKDAEKEMQYFFRQSIRVQTYLFQKKDQLVKELVKTASQKYGFTEEEIREDGDLFKKYVEDSPEYQNFINSPIHAAVTVLSQHNLFDDKIDNDLNNIIIDIDNDRNKILRCKEGEKDIIEQINEKKKNNETLDANDDKKLGEACDSIIGKIDDISEVAQDSAWNIWSDLFRNGDANLREYLQKSGLDNLFLSLKEDLLKDRQSLKNGELTNDKKIDLSEMLNYILFLKKEVYIGKYTITRDYDENGNIIYRIPGFLVGSIGNICKSREKLHNKKWIEGYTYLSTGLMGPGAILTAGGLVYACRTGKTGYAKLGAVLMSGPLGPAIAGGYYGLSRYTPLQEFGHKINIFKYKGKGGAETLINDLLDGKVSLNRAGEIIERRCFPLFGSKEIRDEWRKTFSVGDDLKEGFDMRKVAFDRIVKKSREEGVLVLNELKKERELYEELIKKYDTSVDIRRAVLKGTIEDMKNSLGESGEIVKDARKAFNGSIDRAVGKLEAMANKRAVQPTIDKLKALKTDKSLAEDEMKAFSKFIDDGFHPKFIPELKKLFAIEDIATESGEKLGTTLKRYISEGDFTQFKNLLKDSKYEKIFKDAGLDDALRRGLIDNLDTAFRKFGNLLLATTKKTIQNVMKIISKIL